MLRRQQANAVIAARSRIVEGAVGMVEMALEQLSAKKVVEPRRGAQGADGEQPAGRALLGARDAAGRQHRDALRVGGLGRARRSVLAMRGTQPQPPCAPRSPDHGRAEAVPPPARPRDVRGPPGLGRGRPPIGQRPASSSCCGVPSVTPGGCRRREARRQWERRPRRRRRRPRRRRRRPRRRRRRPRRRAQPAGTRAQPAGQGRAPDKSALSRGSGARDVIARCHREHRTGSEPPFATRDGHAAGRRLSWPRGPSCRSRPWLPSRGAGPAGSRPWSGSAPVSGASSCSMRGCHSPATDLARWTLGTRVLLAR